MKTFQLFVICDSGGWIGRDSSNPEEVPPLPKKKAEELLRHLEAEGWEGLRLEPGETVDWWEPRRGWNTDGDDEASE
jgi:hypothetical protein